MAPGRAWRRPLTLIYNDNYRYGTGLYTPTLDDIEKKYNDSMTRTKLGSDRLDLHLSAMAGSQLTGATPSLGGSDLSRKPDFTSDLLAGSFNPSRPETSTFADYEHFKQKTLSSVEEQMTAFSEDLRTRRRQKRAALDSYYETIPYSPHYASDFNSTYWTDRCKELQAEVERLSEEMKQVEVKLKNETVDIKHKLHVEVADLAIALDEANRVNQDLDKTIKKQANQLLELQRHYENLQRRIQQALEQLEVSHSRLQSVRSEVVDLKISAPSYESAEKARSPKTSTQEKNEPEEISCST